MTITTHHSLPDVVRRRLAPDDRALLDAQIYGRRSNRYVDQRRSAFEIRREDDGTVSLGGYATTWDTWYDVAGGAPYGWSESIAAGAATRSLAERDDVRFLFDHQGIPMARNISQTMELVADEIGLRVDIPNLDVARNAFAAALASALDRQDVDQMSFAFQAVRQEWNSDYTERYITELRLFDVSAVTFPANTATIMALREQYMEQQETRRSGYSLNRARAEALRLLG